jgi:hypothetical protein
LKKKIVDFFPQGTKEYKKSNFQKVPQISWDFVLKGFSTWGTENSIFADFKNHLPNNNFNEELILNKLDAWNITLTLIQAILVRESFPILGNAFLPYESLLKIFDATLKSTLLLNNLIFLKTLLRMTSYNFVVNLRESGTHQHPLKLYDRAQNENINLICKSYINKEGGIGRFFRYGSPIFRFGNLFWPTST